MPIFKRENEYYNSYSDCASYFKEIGAYTVEDYKRDTEAKIARLEEKDKKSQAEIKKSHAEIKLYKEKDEKSQAVIKSYKDKDEKSQAVIKSICESAYKNIGSVGGVAKFLSLSVDTVKSILNLNSNSLVSLYLH